MKSLSNFFEKTGSYTGMSSRQQSIVRTTSNNGKVKTPKKNDKK